MAFLKITWAFLDLIVWKYLSKNTNISGNVKHWVAVFSRQKSKTTHTDSGRDQNVQNVQKFENTKCWIYSLVKRFCII